MDCTTTLAVITPGTVNAPASTLVLPYSSSATPVDYTSTWLKLFTTVDNVNCPVTSCLLMDATCSTTPTANANFYINSAGSPWELKYKRNVVAGWAEQTFCVKCSGASLVGAIAFNKQTQNSLKIRQVRNCDTYIALKATLSLPSATQTLAFSSTPGTTKVITQAEIVTITDETDCGKTVCSLYTQNSVGACTTSAFTTTNNQILVGAFPNYDITIK